MPAFDIIALDTSTPQLRVPGASDTYNLPRITSIAAGTLTTAVSPLSVSATYNDAGVTFPGVVYNVTDTASAAASLIMNWQVGGVSRLSLSKSGQLWITGTNTSNSPSLRLSNMGAGTGFISGAWAGGGAFDIAESGGRATLVSTNKGGIRVNSLGAGSVLGNFSVDCDSGATAADTNALFGVQRAGLQVFAIRPTRIVDLFGAWTDASNYRRLSQGMSAAGVAFLRPEGAGTGASGNVLHISGLPTSNPGAGILWNDAGTVKVGT